MLPITPPLSETAPPDSLAAFLTRLRWNPEIDGPLLIVAPDRLRSEELAALPDDPRELPIAPLADAVRRRVARLGSVTTLIPLLLPQINRVSSSRGSDAFDPDAVLALLDALPASALRNLAKGIEARDLPDAKRRALFDRAIPNRASFPNRPRVKPPPTTIERDGETEDGEFVADIPDSELARARLTFHWRWDCVASDLSGQDIRLRGQTRPVPPFVSVPEKAKATDLDTSWDGLNGAVSLVDAKTVGELVERVARVSRVNLAADPRLAALPVFVKGDTARAGDILAALVRALGGAFRRIECSPEPSLFLLTDDRVPLGTRASALHENCRSDWYETDSKARVDQARAVRSLRRRLRRDGLGVLNLPLSPLFSPEISRRALRGEAVTVPLSALSPDDRRVILDHEAELRSDDPKRAAQPPLSEIDVSLELDVRVFLPSRGESSPFFVFWTTHLLGYATRETSTKPLALPRGRVRALRISLPESDSDALIDAVKAVGFTQLWVDLPPIDPNDPQRIDARFVKMAARAKQMGLGVVPVLCVAAAPPNAPDSRKERDFLGRTRSEWARVSPVARGISALGEEQALAVRRIGARDRLWPDSVDFDALAARLARLKTVAGVVAIGLTDCLPESLALDWRGLQNPIAFAPSPVRIAKLVRDERVDARDILPDSLRFPLESGSGNAVKALLSGTATGAILDSPTNDAIWEQQQKRRREPFVARLVGALTRAGLGAKGGPPLRILRDSPNGEESRRWELWRGSAMLIETERQGSEADVDTWPSLTPSPLIETLAEEIFLDDRLIAERFARYLTQSFEVPSDENDVELPVAWSDGFVIDVSFWPESEAREFLGRWLRAPT